MIVILHNIRSMHNVGSIFRTAEAAGVEKIYLCGITPTPIDKYGRKRQAIAKVSLGAEDYIAWEYSKSTTRLIDKLKKQKYKIIAIEQSKKSIPYYKFQSKKQRTDLCKFLCKFSRGTSSVSSASCYTLVLGNEIKGLPHSILARADYILEIPMRGKKESLNVAVAFGIVVFHLINKERM